MKVGGRNLAALVAWGKALQGAAPFSYYLEEARAHGLDGEDPAIIQAMREVGCVFCFAEPGPDGDDAIIIGGNDGTEISTGCSLVGESNTPGKPANL